MGYQVLTGRILRILRRLHHDTWIDGDSTHKSMVTKKQIQECWSNSVLVPLRLEGESPLNVLWHSLSCILIKG